MELGEKERVIVLVALHHYMKTIEELLANNGLDDDERADLVNDASLLEIIISGFEEKDI